MIWRWIIRGLGIALLTLCMTAWVGSYWRDGYVGYRGTKSNQDIMLMGGRICFGREKSAPMAVTGWYCGSNRRPERWMDWDNRFEYQKEARYSAIYVPLWFPTLLSAGCLWLVWRKTRPKYSGKDFPVEPAAQPPKP